MKPNETTESREIGRGEPVLNCDQSQETNLFSHRSKALNVEHTMFNGDWRILEGRKKAWSRDQVVTSYPHSTLRSPISSASTAQTLSHLELNHQPYLHQYKMAGLTFPNRRDPAELDAS